jgi:Flp pilus assembly protein CpaB
VSRRARALGFLGAALLAAVGAAAIADGYGNSVARGYGALRPVVVAARALPAGHEIDPEAAAGALQVRRVPARFVPPGTLAAAAEAIGLVPRASFPAGSYLLAGQLRPPGSGRRPGRILARGRRPVEIEVGGAGALLAGAGSPVGSRVDVVVTDEPSDSGRGRTYVAAAAVPLLGLEPSAEPGGEATSAATLGLTRPQALRLIAAESFARRVTILPSAG